ncbi:hypothetical protein ACFSKI_19755 [Pseudogracilibacillus auburnensis]|uniref:Putative membrane protein YkvI n=1 Tax=Pseudogracilibacillus auburnensis TaxID=1494959 RepID=A0A2V3VT79_9BACI|nr:hypothetical protein [Pseudogracilibacillus auburnensis]PXW85093.1 putative membrane protein YkvI [Pseudogracilibacillus auburnensis]
MKTSLRIGAVYISTIIGAGFASGQEILQYFTYYGWIGFLGALLATLLFAWLGYQIADLGSKLGASSHKGVIMQLGGKYFGTIVDYIIILACLNATVVMIAGGGSLLNQLFNVPIFIGSAILTICVAVTLCLDLQQVINVIGSVTPMLIIMALILAIYAFMTTDLSFSDIGALAQPDLTASPNWVLSAVLYVSYNVIMAVAILSVIGGAEKDNKIAAMGGLYGGIGLGLLVIVMNLGLIVKLDKVEGVEMPTLLFASDIAPWIAIVMGLVIFGMVFSTAAGALYAFVCRIVKPEKSSFKLMVIGFSVIAYILSFVGFSKLIGTVYPMFGYLGLLLIIIVFVQWIRHRKLDTPEKGEKIS